MDLRPPEAAAEPEARNGAGRRTVRRSSGRRASERAGRRAAAARSAARVGRRLVVTGSLLAACTEAPVSPATDTALRIHLESEVVRETAVAVGDSIPLTLRPVNGGASGARVEASWEVQDPAIARLSGTTSSEVHLHGLAFGETRVVASSGAVSDTVVVSVLSPGSGGWCDGEGLELSRGQSITTTAAAASPLCLAAIAEENVTYVVVPFNAATTGQKLRVEVAVDGGVGADEADEAGTAGTAGLALRVPERDVAGSFDRRLREMETRELGPLVRRGGGEPIAARAALAAAVPSPGDTLSLNVNADQTCGSPQIRRARVVSVGAKSILLEDLNNPSGGFTAEDYERFASSFDGHVYPTITRYFGEPTDVDGNGRVLILFTGAVNELTPAGSDSYVAGFFFARDLFPRQDSDGLGGCVGSNVGELLYMLAPDPTGEINGNVRPRSAVAERTVGILGHELQHLISASRRLRVLRVDRWNEEFWLNEGLSHIAEELLFYESTSLEPGQEITITRLRATLGAVGRFNEYQAANFSRYSTYLKDPAGGSPFSGAELSTRGSAWAFLRYAADRYGGDEGTLWRRLIDSNTTGYDNLLGALEASPLAWMHDWAVALYTDDLTNVPARFRQPSWNYRSIMPALGGTGGTYPLAVSDLATLGGTATFELTAGGAGIARLRALSGQPARLTITSGGAPAPTQLRFTIVRTR